MKKIWWFVLGLFFLSFVCNFTQAKDYEYTNLNITANILNDWTIKIKEDFTANFFVNKHWIIRDIPLNYTVDWNDFHIEVSNINVLWENFTTSKSNWEQHIKIWDGNKTVFWKQNYPISYTTYWLIKNFSWMWYTELYWNLVWYGFDTNINNVRAELILPKNYTWFTKDDFLITTDWNSKTIDWFEWTVDWSSWDRIIITYDKWLSAYHWITLAIKFPNNYFKFDHDRQANLVWHVWYSSITKNKWDYKYFSRCICILICTWLFVKLSKLIPGIKIGNKINLNEWKLKWKFAKDFPVIIQYNPPKWLNSADVWLLLHRQARAQDMLSLIYKRAYEGIIHIENIGINLYKEKNTSTDVKILKIKDISNKNPSYEKVFFNNLLKNGEVKIDKYTNLYKDLNLQNLNNYWIDKWWLKKNDVRIIWCLWFMFLSLLFLFFPLFGWIGIFIYALIFCSSFIILSIIWDMSQKMEETEKWAKLISHILWYRNFLAKCDENKLRLFLKKDPLYFDKTLPYAIVFWLETELIDKITPIMKEMNVKPAQYIWNLSLLSESISTISSSADHSWWETTYLSSGWFSGWSSFDSWWSSFSSGWGWGWGWWSSW